jgi:Ca-activated chloride channel family protein
MKLRLIVPLLFLLFLGGTVPAQAQIEPIPIPPPIFRGSVTIEYQRVEVTIEDQIATTHIDQLFVNDNDFMLEGTYLFPLPQGAVVSELTMWVNGEPIEAKILERDEARAIYDEIVRQLRDPALLEYVGTQAIQASVFPIPPDDERRIEITYSQVLPADNGLVHYVYPQSTDLYTNLPLDSQSIRVEVRSNEAIRAIYSPSHRVYVARNGDFEAVVGFEEEDVLAEQDFELYYTITPEDIGLNLLSYKESGQDGFFLLLVAPSVEVDPSRVIAKDVVLVVDTSGSMEGEKIIQARQAARFVIERLNPEDRFNIVSFATGVRKYADDLVPASQAAEAETFINNLEALGGTNISLALLEAVQQGSPERPLTVLFLTDGLATEGIVDTPLLLETIQREAPDSTRLFAFGVGDDVDTVLLDSLAENHRGATSYVRPGQQIDEQVGAFYAKVSTPVLADLEIDYDGIVVEQTYPSTLPDLFAGSQLVIAGRYRDGGPAAITLRGTVNGVEQIFTYQDNLFRSSGGDEFIPRLWATRAIGHLMNEIRLRGENSELVESIINLSLRYGIITPYTSYLIEEDDIFEQLGRGEIDADMAAGFNMADEVSGEEAVDDAVAAEAMEEAEVAAPAPVVTGNDASGAVVQALQLVGSKTFTLQDGVWVDTAFNSDTMTPQQVGFASDNYFDLLTAAPEMGQYLALGEQVLVVFDEVAYEIVPGEGQPDVTLPDPSTDEGNASTGGETVEPEATAQPAPGETVEPVDTPESGDASSPASGVCASALLLPLAFGLAVMRRRKADNSEL